MQAAYTITKGCNKFSVGFPMLGNNSMCFALEYTYLILSSVQLSVRATQSDTGKT